MGPAGRDNIIAYVVSFYSVRASAMASSTRIVKLKLWLWRRPTRERVGRRSPWVQWVQSRHGERGPGPRRVEERDVEGPAGLGTLIISPKQGARVLCERVPPAITHHSRVSPRSTHLRSQLTASDRLGWGRAASESLSDDPAANRVFRSKQASPLRASVSAASSHGVGRAPLRAA